MLTYIYKLKLSQAIMHTAAGPEFLEDYFQKGALRMLVPTFVFCVLCNIFIFYIVILLHYSHFCFPSQSVSKLSTVGPEYL